MALWDYRSATAGNANTTGTTGTLQFAAAVTAGDLLVCSARIAGTAQNPTCSDDVNGGWTKILHSEFNGDTIVTFAFFGTGAGTPTVTLANATSGTRRWTIQSYDSGSGNSIVADKTSASSGSSTTLTSGSTATTTNASELLYGAAMVSGSATFTQGSGYTKRQEVVQKMATEDRVVGSTGTYSADWSIGATDTWGAQIITFMATVTGDLSAHVGEPKAGGGVLN